MRPADERAEEQREDGEFEFYFQRTRESPLILTARSLAQAGLLERLSDSPKGATVIGLEHQEGSRALGPDLRGDVPLGSPSHPASRCSPSGAGSPRSNAGIATISFDLPSTAHWPSASPCALAPRRLGGDRLGRQVWPSCVAERVLAAVDARRLRRARQPCEGDLSRPGRDRCGAPQGPRLTRGTSRAANHRQV